MKIALICSECFSSIVDSQATLELGSLFYVPLGDSPLYKATCPYGHTSSYIITNPKYELLYESGVKALEDGYYREAVSSFAAALERFYEFLIQSHFVDENTTQLPKAFHDTWKVLSTQSERQLGAFYMLYMHEFGQAAPVVDNKFVQSLKLDLGIKGNEPTTFRNKVIHQGYIPRREQVIAYGEVISYYIHNILVTYCEAGREGKLQSAFRANYYTIIEVV